VTEWSGRGFGFISFADGRRAYVHHSAIGGGNLQHGEKVTAVLTEDSQNPGKWAATEVQRGPVPQQQSNAARQPAHSGTWQPASTVPTDPTHEQGVVVEWNERGYGFILFADGRRAYVHHSSVSGSSTGPVDLQQGEVVEAIVVEDAQNPGKWAALDVQRRLWGSAFPAVASGAPQPMRASQAPCHAAFASGPAAGPRMEGVVIEWNTRGYGFILFPDGRRAYVHHSSMGGGNLVQGETVTAVVAEDNKNPGKWAAVDVQRGPLRLPPQQLQSQQPLKQQQQPQPQLQPQPQPQPQPRAHATVPRFLSVAAGSSEGNAPDLAMADVGHAVVDPYPSVEQIQQKNNWTGCVTIESPLARSNLVKRVAPPGTPCIFRADAWDEALHCIDADKGTHGQFGWCWTKLDRSEWGSCSKACPLAGDVHTLSEKLERLEGLVAQLSAMAGLDI